MSLSQITTDKLILLDSASDTKQAVLEALVAQLDQEGYLSDSARYMQDVLERESLSDTGLPEGAAIPHGKSPGVRRAGVAIARLQKAILWEGVEDNAHVDMVFLLAIPSQESGNTHMRILSELATALLEEGYLERLRQSKDVVSFLQALDYRVESETAAPSETSSDKKIVAITACATGVAHTYMAAEALEKAAAQLGVQISVEKQGASGLENALDAKKISEADAAIFANDVALRDMGRFHGKPYVQTRVAEPLKHAKELIQRALTQPDGVFQGQEQGGSLGTKATPSSSEEKEASQEIQAMMQELGQAVMTGISYMIPVIVAAGTMIAVAKLGAMPFGLTDSIQAAENATSVNPLIVLLYMLNKVGGLLFLFIYPVFASYMAFSIAGRVGLLSGLLGGIFAAGLHSRLWGIADAVPSGFWGALALGALAGYVSRYLNEKIQLPKRFLALKPMLLIPLLSALSIFLANYYVVEPSMGALNAWIMEIISSASDAGTYAIGSVIAAATAFDLGGPINKAAGAIAIGLAADKVYPLTPRVLSIVIPPIGLGLATVLDRFVVGKRVFPEDLRTVGETSILLGLIAISEGAIPFMLRNPLITIPINILGAIIGSVTAMALGAVQWYPLPAVWGWPLVENLWAYLLGLLAGALFIALTNIFVRASLQSQGKLN